MNHPGRTPRPVQSRMLPEELRAIIYEAGITQQRAADLTGAALRSMQQYLSGDRPIPLSVSWLLCVSIILLDMPHGPLTEWLRPDLADAIARKMRIAP